MQTETSKLDELSEFNVAVRPQRPYGLLGTSTSTFSLLLSSDRTNKNMKVYVVNCRLYT